MPNICNPNLLDNWYFGNPVDQRDGYVVPPQTPYFTLSDTEWNQVGVTEGYYAITGTNGSGGAYTISIGGTAYMVTKSAAVRGYAGTGYTIDRWRFGGYTQTIEVTGNGITWNTNTGVWWMQTIENWDSLVGKTATVSALIGGNLYSVSGVVNNSDRISVVVSETVQLEISPETRGVRLVSYVIESTSVGAVLAVKLELGSQQTLAHQENGVWVLNEIPDYGEQLRRCQRYYQRLKASSGYMRFGISQPYTDTAAGVFIPLQVEMRTTPSMFSSGNFALFAGSALHGVNLSLDTASPYNVTLQATGTGLPGTSAQLLANADTSAYIEFSADL